MLKNKLKKTIEGKLTNLSEVNYYKQNHEYRDICTC